MSDREIVVLPRAASERLGSWGARWGTLDYQYDTNEGVLVITGSSNADKERYGTDGFSWADEHYLHVTPVHSGGLWYQADAEAFSLNAYLRATGSALQVEGLRRYVGNAWKTPPIHDKLLVLTRSTVDDTAAFAAWTVCGDEVAALSLELVSDQPATDRLAPYWPVEDLKDARIALIGCGSIGSTIAARLASAGVGQISLIDPDRLLDHNVVRHELGRRHLGRHKVVAVEEELLARYHGLDVEAVPRDAVSEADYVRPIVNDSTIVVCATDGVESRRAVNHLARRAGKPAIFACVLEDGAFGEVIRVRPGYACLACMRRALVERGAIDPEPGIDEGYGTGSRHRPMTAVPTDLRFVADLAAKAVLATLLRMRGHGDQQLAGDHAVVALRPVPGRPPPFDLHLCGAIRWERAGSSYNDCVTCGIP